MSDFEQMLSGGHPNSLGRTEDVVKLVLADNDRLDELYRTYFSSDEVVRLRTASAMKRVAIARPDLVLGIMDKLQSEVAAIDQPSVQWTLALIFDLTADDLSPAQHHRATEIMKRNVAESDDWIVLSNSMKVLGKWAEDDPALARWLRPHAERLIHDRRKSVSRNATKLLARLDTLPSD